MDLGVAKPTDLGRVSEWCRGDGSAATTQKYLGVNYASVRTAVEEMSVCGEPHRSPFGQFTEKRGRRNPFFGARSEGI